MLEAARSNQLDSLLHQSVNVASRSMVLDNFHDKQRPRFFFSSIGLCSESVPQAVLMQLLRRVRALFTISLVLVLNSNESSGTPQWSWTPKRTQTCQVWWLGQPAVLCAVFPFGGHRALGILAAGS